MLWDLFEAFGLFDNIDTRPNHYHSDEHLGLMIALMGPPPKELLERGSTSATYFDEEGRFRHPKLIPEGFCFESSITRFRGKDKELFIDFAKKMICWLPEERWTAKQLLDHPWLEKRDDTEDTVPTTKLRLDVDSNNVSGTRKTNSASASASASPTAAEADSNSASGDLIRSILDRK